MIRHEPSTPAEAPIAIEELKARARALAASEDGAARVDAGVSWLVFGSAGEWFALPLTDVQEILRGARIAPVPHTPAAVRGVVNRRGDIVPVIDLAVVAGRRATSAAAAMVIVIVGRGPAIAGVVSDGWPETIEVSDADFAALPQPSPLVQSVCHHGGRLIKRLAVEPLVDPDIYRLTADDNTGQSGARATDDWRRTT